MLSYVTSKTRRIRLAKVKEELIDKYKDEARVQGLEFVKRIKNGVGLYRNPECGHEFEYQITAVRSLYKVNAKPRCPVCLDEYKRKCEQEAQVELIGPHRSGSYRFRRIDCNHELLVSYDYLEKHKEAKCSKCESERLSLEAEQGGLQIIGKQGRDYIYKLPCGHSKVISGKCVRTGGWRCTECYEEKIKESALNFGFEYIGDSPKGPHYRLCRVIACGHLKDVQVHDITNRPRKGICKECIELKHKEEAVLADLELVGMPDNNDPNYRKYRTNCCSTEHDFMVTHVRRNSYTCPACGNSHLDNFSDLYLYKMTNGNLSWLKLGFSNNVSRRLAEYDLVEGTSSELLKTTRVPTGRIAIKLEKMLHSKFKQNKLDSTEMRKYFNVSGFNECYPLEMLDTLLGELEKIQHE